jgi:hypothetical protein
MKKIIFLFLVLFAKVSFAQYCGYSSPNICSPTSTLTSPGISDFHTFPYVHDSLPYSEVMEIYFPGTVSAAGLNVHVDSVRIDSITNLPCGLCWAANDSSFTYPGLGRACVKLSGTTYDTAGAYRLNLYGMAYTSFGAFPGDLSVAGLNFFLHVVGKNAGCTAIDTSHLYLACNGLDTSTTVVIGPVVPNVTPCHFHIDVASTPVANCNFDSATLTLTQPVTSSYRHYWTRWNFVGVPTVNIDSTSLSFTYHYNDNLAQLTVVDSTGCGDTLTFDLLEHAGPVVEPRICYATSDTSQSSSLIRFVFERNDFLSNVATYTLFRQDSSFGLNLSSPVGTSSGSAPGYITDAHPHAMDTTYSSCPQCDLNDYHMGYITTCGDTQTNNSFFYVSSELRVLRHPTYHLPMLVWTNSNPLNYDTIFIYSRAHNGHWRLRYSTANLATPEWFDSYPDSNGMEYMLGYHLIVDCDPLRAAAHYAFSNFGKVTIADSLVVRDTTAAPNGIAKVSSGASILVYPNPANAKLYVQTTASGDVDLNIYDMQGRLMTSKTVSGNKVNEINVEELSGEVYIVNLVQNGRQIAVERFIKQ